MSSALVGISPTPVEVPSVVHALAQRLRAGATVVPVWRNEYGGLTVRLEDRGSGADLALESGLQPDRVPARRPARLSNPRPSTGDSGTGGRRAGGNGAGRNRAGGNGAGGNETGGRTTSESTAYGSGTSGATAARRPRPSSYLKWVPRGAPCPDPLAEADRLVWAASVAAAPQTALPRVLGAGRNAHGSWMLTAAVEVGGAAATSAIEPQWRARAARSAIAIGVGLRRLHDALPTATCPFVRTAESRLAALTADVAPWPGSRAVRTAPRPDVPLGAPPPVDRLVVCHGDATVPNTLFDHVGRFAAHVDVGDLGVADRWSDLAVTTRSVTRRYGPGLEPLVLAAYGVAPDPVRTGYYRALWDAEEAVRTRRAS